MASLVSRSAQGTYTFCSPPRAFLERDNPLRSGSGVRRFGNENEKRDYRRPPYYFRPHVLNPWHDALSKKSIGKLSTLSHKVLPIRNFALSTATLNGRQHVKVQTELLLEKIPDPIHHTDAECQTDHFHELMPPSLSHPDVPSKCVADAETQVEKGELFDFDEEIQPVLENLVSHSLHQALVEVLEKNEISQLLFRQHFGNPATDHLNFLNQDNKEKTVDADDKKEKQNLPAGLSQDESFVPWLKDQVENEIAKLEKAKKLLDSLVEESLQIPEEEDGQPNKDDDEDPEAGNDEQDKETTETT